MPYEIDLAAGDAADTYQRLPAWARRSLDEALTTAATDPQALPEMPLLPYCRILEYADGRGRCLLEVDEDAKRIAVRQIQPLT
ncbi:hypothetical protein [Actinacidiphila soli]|uniref:hypothetical protein n=1 Tax=Actinacidiphila soli TaxID=2487275 RepID=UPI000FCC6C0F|nr:hypothetical protein [Actinacidiphila soli]